ncbi:MAG: electron transfer flavoprotein subunit beta/FixA family protein [Syntrophomonadaceae bacterium]|jgi:electron transfer flavoprotein beta subunit|nr:electron transfer flavoprotein subunit beta/FixA family protein [Syntrophomonadaceae bacterium]MDH7498549.1 electron transfer flavoprotein subunit beta/FixA family protein [Syntrophomonadaceae bacterium]
MNIVVAMKQVPDLQQIRIRDRQPVMENVPLTLGAIDRNALEAAVRLKEAGDATVTVLMAGNGEVEETVKEALAAGADRACLVVDEALQEADGAVVAQVLAAAIRGMEDVKLVLFGEGSADNYSGQVGSRVAALLGWPQVGFAASLEVEGDTVRVVRALEDEDEVLESPAPLVVTVLGDINEPRIPSVSQILKAGRKPKEVLEPRELGVEVAARNTTATVSSEAPDTRREGRRLHSVEELLAVLRAEGFTRG